jgi:hypothetical protein
VINLIPPFRNTLKHAKIEPLRIPQEKLDELKAVLADPNLPDVLKTMMISRTCGSCHSCGQMPTQIATYGKYGAIVIEKYCDQCLARINA